MKRKEKNGIVWLESKLLEPYQNVKHAFYLKHGGVSSDSFASLNFSKTTGDSEANVDQNVAKALGVLEIENYAKPNMVHGNTIAQATAHSDGAIVADGFSTQTKELALLTTCADCQCAIFYDPVHHAIANTHCGWKGNVLNAYASTIEHMKKTYCSNPNDLIVCVGPSLGPNKSEFIHYEKELPRHFWQYRVSEFHFNLWQIARMQLRESGIRDENMDFAEICTYENPQDCFSHRTKQKGRHGVVIALT